jgi:hypothetical protein
MDSSRFGTASSTRYSYAYEVQQLLRGTATPTRYSYAYEVQLRLWGTATPTRYSYAYEVQLHLRGTASPRRYSYAYDVQLRLRKEKYLKLTFGVFTDGSILSVGCEPMDRWSSVKKKFCHRWSILSVKNENFFTNGSILSVESITDSIDRYYRSILSVSIHRSIADCAQLCNLQSPTIRYPLNVNRILHK